ncbi:MAG: cytochrome C [Betaproteobacteria bacterium HGW-Betaproteobacteria-7]|jgi:octaheme c-type cytochrome (tetrathionate reductase family)|nr:MAG: cytochrome C [Betaproteobacteria bacterium HGW-Betaproteobacteria-7]
MSQTKLLFAASLLGAVLAWSTAWGEVPGAARPANLAVPSGSAIPLGESTVDHSKLKELQKNFASGPEVTKACLSCHTEAAKQVQHTKHWTWEYTDPKSGQKLGKKNIINNFCTTSISNEKDCMACHAGYGWKDANFDFTAEANVDCLICHDSTATYRKLPGDAGHPVYERREFPHGSGKFVEAVDLQKVAQSVALPSRSNCGSCHFYGAGGDGTKHGDLDSALKKPGKYLDVHMDAKGLNFTCSTCHATAGHKVSGSRYEMAAALTGPAETRGKAAASPAACQSCHGDKPHKESILHAERLNTHSNKLACQTCHIPQYARDSIGTEISWDWSTATRMGTDGKPFLVKDSAGRRAFDSKKGNFVWDSYVVPEYRWFNGHVSYKTKGERIDPGQIVEINRPEGEAGQADSRIWPFKIHRGKQAYDSENNYLVVVHTAGEDDTALWANFDWQKAIGAGMQTAGMRYSGKFGFVSTEMSWPITHMVAPKNDALGCAQCHRENGRLEGITGIYLPGRDHSYLLDNIGWMVVLLSLLGVLIHGGTRAYLHFKHKG